MPFTYRLQIGLCGHGCLGAGAALITKYGQNTVTLDSQYGRIEIEGGKLHYKIRLPSWPATPLSYDEDIIGSGIAPVDVFSTRDLILVLDSENDVAQFEPDFELMSSIEDFHAVIVTAQSSDDNYLNAGYVLRYFAPKIGIPEDLATGSAQCSLAPYWCSKLGVNKISARQLSASGGYFEIEQVSGSSILITAQVQIPH